MRQCECGIACVANDVINLTFLFGAFFGLQGKPQTVPRSELFAIVVLCRVMQPFASAEVVTDSLIVAKGFASRRSLGILSGLWTELWRRIKNKTSVFPLGGLRPMVSENLFCR